MINWMICWYVLKSFSMSWENRGVTDDPAHFQKLMKEQSDLQPIVDAYKEYKKNKETIEDSLSMLESEKDEEMREMLKEELSDAKKESGGAGA